MGIPILGDILDSILGEAGDIVSEVVVDKDKRNEIRYKLEELKDRGNERLHEQMIAQAATNTAEAKHSSIFVAGWRPAVGWVCAAGLAVQVIILPFISGLADVTFPFDTELLILTMSGMLGIGGLRTYEKVKGVDTVSYPTKAPERPEGTPESILPPLYASGLPENAPWTT